MSYLCKKNKMTEKIQQLRNEIALADAIVVGGASGLSASAGFRYYYQDDEVFRQIAGSLADKYQVHNVFDLFYHPRLTREEYWAVVLRQTVYVYDCYTGRVYELLAQILKGKQYHIVTTNQDAQFYRTFKEENIARLQGDWRYWQCANGCHDEIYLNEEKARELAAHIEGDRLAKEYWPRCKKCGGEMDIWVRSRHFLQGKLYEQEVGQYLGFIRSHARERILFLELGVGMMTPMFIKEPFMNMVYQLPQARYVTINPQHAIIPKEIAPKSLAIAEDITKVFAQVLGQDTSKMEVETSFNPRKVY